MNPYQELPSRAFWRVAVAEPGVHEINDVWQPKFVIEQDAPVITAGSCFAAEIGKRLIEHGMNWYDAEPPPPGLSRQERKARHYREFSFRTGNIYTAAVLKQWVFWAFARSEPSEEGWLEAGRCYDPYRPSVDPDGHDSLEAMLQARTRTLSAIRDAVTTASCFIFTMGLTEAWMNRVDGTVYPVCPGTVRGSFDPTVHELHNYSFGEVHRDMSETTALLREANPELRLLLTVSPVPLTATATGAHALVATTHSKSVLRAVAGQLATEHDHVDYFPSYELITGQPFRSGFYEPNLRTVTPEGVSFVMRHFMASLGRTPTPRTQRPARPLPAELGGDECDDAILDYYSPR
jgi:hypothetical protein